MLMLTLIKLSENVIQRKNTVSLYEITERKERIVELHALLYTA